MKMATASSIDPVRSAGTGTYRQGLRALAASRFHRLAASALALPMAVSFALLFLLAPAAMANQASVQLTTWQGTAFRGLHQSTGVAAMANGNIVIADSLNGRILLETLVGTNYVQSVVYGGLSYSFDVAVDPQNNIYVADSSNNRVIKLTPSGSSYSLTVVDSNLSEPYGLAVDANGNVYVADTYNNRIVKEVRSDSGYLQYIVDTQVAQPQGVGVDAAGAVYIADSGNARIKKDAFDGDSWVSTIIPTTTPLSQPVGVAVDSSGNLYISDTVGPFVLKEKKVGNSYVETVLANSYLGNPFGLTVDSNGSVFVSDSSGININAILSGRTMSVGNVSVGQKDYQILTYTTSAPVNLGTPVVLTAGQPYRDFALDDRSTCSGAMDGGETCKVVVAFTPRSAGAIPGAVQIVDSTGNVLATSYISGIGAGPQVAFSPISQSVVDPQMDTPRGVAVDAAGNLFVVNKLGAITEEIPSGGVYTQKYLRGVPFSGWGNFWGLAIDAANNIYTTRCDDGKVSKGVPDGQGGLTVTDVFQGGGCVTGIAVDPVGNIYFMQASDNYVVKETVTSTGYTESHIPVSSTTSPYGLTVDSAGNIYVADTQNFRILKETLTPTGYVESIIDHNGVGPVGLVVDPAGNIYSAAQALHLIYKFTPSGNGYTRTELGVGLNAPWGLALDAAGNLFVADYGTYQVYELQQSAPGSIHFPTATQVGTLDSTDGSQTLTISNNGNGALEFFTFPTDPDPRLTTGFTITGSDFPVLDPDGEPAFLGAGNSAHFSIGFTPYQAGQNDGRIDFRLGATDGQGPVYSSILSGTGSNVSMASLAFTTPPPTDLQWDTSPGVVVVTEEDADGARLPSSGDTVYLAIAGPNGYSLTTNTIASNGVATFDLSGFFLTIPGSYTYTASVTHNQNPFSVEANETVSQLTTTVALTSSLNPSLTFNPVTFTATVGGNPCNNAASRPKNSASRADTCAAFVKARPNGLEPPTGTVTFFNGNSTLGRVAVNQAGVAAFTANTLPVGTDNITAVYSGDQVYLTETSNPVAQVVKDFMLVFTPAPPPTRAWGNSPGMFAVSEEDGNGTVLSSANDSIALNLTGPNGYTFSIQTVAVNGVATFNLSGVYLTQPGEYLYTASVNIGGTILKVRAGETVSREPTSVEISSSVNPSVKSNPVTLLAIVGGSCGNNSIRANCLAQGAVQPYQSARPTGTVTFSSGGTALADPVQLDQKGGAELVISSLPVGTSTIQATYSGDDYFLTSGSNSIQQVVEDFDLAISDSGGTATSVTVLPGGTATYQLIVSPVAPATQFPTDIHLTATGLPTGATYSMSPSVITAGSGTTTITLTITTAAPAASRAPSTLGGVASALGPFTFALLLLPFAGRMRRAGRRMGRIVPMLALLIVGLAAAAGMSGCGSSATGFFGQGTKSYTISVTGTSGVLSHSTTVTLIVE